MTELYKNTAYIFASRTAKYWYFNLVQNAYHNWNHIEAVHKSLVQLTALRSKELSSELSLAGLYHDAVYIPGAKGSANELCSAAAFMHDYNLYFKPMDFFKQNPISTDAVQSLIKFTNIETHLTGTRIEGDLAYLLDADLSSLAAPYDEFLNNQINILAENQLKFPEDSDKSVKFLEKFLSTRENIFHTNEGRILYQDRAVQNITKFVQDLK
jgi:predicted metal-dependent HD superfamily phosphohydrolase